jgi:hypothetical protein
LWLLLLAMILSALTLIGRKEDALFCRSVDPRIHDWCQPWRDIGGCEWTI